MKRSLLLLTSACLLAGLLLIVGVWDVSHAQEPVEQTVLCFRRSADAFCAPRPLELGGDLADRLQRVLQALVSGPTPQQRAAGVWSAIPQEAELANVTVEGARVSVYLVLPETYLERFNPLLSDQLVEQIVKTLRPFRSEIMSAARIQGGSPDDRLIVHVLAQDPWDPAHPFRDLSYFLFEPPLEHKPRGDDTETGRQGEETAVQRLLLSDGFLSGKAVYVSAGHGWYWNPDFEEWLTQRPVWEDLVEDFNNAEVVNQYLLPYLYNAGADVWTVRERDLIAHEITVTVDAPGYGQAGEWLDPTEPITGSSLILPWRYAPVSVTATATATWTFTPTQTARTAVYVWYAHGPDRAPDARYRIKHAGGSSEQQIDQTVHGLTWRYLGSYPFYADQPASVSLVNVSDVPGRTVSAGAVRIGGGIGSELGAGDPPSPTASGRPRWEEASRYWAKYQGAPPSVYHPSINDLYDDVTARPRYAEWEKPEDEDGVFVSWHTNGSWAHDWRGSESYIYDGTWGGIWTPGSDLLQYFLHRTLVEDARAGWDPNWVDGGMQADNFGEVRLLQTMPGVLMEIAYHDDPDDTHALLDPRFAQLSARAIYRGIVRYFAYRDAVEPVFLPEPPQGLAVRNSGPGEVTLAWLPSPTDGDGPLGDAATGYRVYASPDGFAWGDGISVTGTSYALAGLTPGQLVFVRVTGVNAGGESLPTPTLAARAAEQGRASILLVEAFSRNDRSFTTWQDDGVSIEDTAETGPSRRLFADRTNRQDYTIQHGTAISRPFDSATRNMLHAAGETTTPPVDLNRYGVVDWMAGEESSPEEPIPAGAPEMALSPAEQGLLAAFMERGGSLFISGSEIGLDLVLRDKGPDFYRDVLKATYQGSNAFKRNWLPYPNKVMPTPGGLFDGLEIFRFDDGTHGTYDADRVDYFLPLPEDRRSQSALLYQAGIGHAGLTWDSGGCSRLVYFAFPFETIYPAETRQAVM
ncbi:MAG: fibronectin type III domain-containing protein, partial [Chloroflexi bacterium]|nr:fibronectin type III domain-containing protein [Chloroflexota bacterium]